MIDDITPQRPAPPQRSKPKIIEPLEKPEQTPLHELAKAEDPTFETPEEVAAHEEPAATPIVSRHDTRSHHDPQPPHGQHLLPAHTGSRWSRLKDWVRPPYTRKQAIVGGAAIIVLVAGIGAGWTLTHHKRTVVADKPKKSVQKKVVPPASLNQKPVTAVMVENSLDARPQSGLSAAGVVFEAVAEGGVTRFMALYQDTTPTDVGPIRSARPYYIQWAMGFDAAYAHVGGSPAALADIASWGVKDMNQFSNGGSYHRISSRAAPHNVYTGIDTLNQLESQKGYTSTYTGFTRKKEAASKTPTATSLDFSLSGYTYDPHYDYNATTNSYNRSEAGEPQTDANTSAQLSPKVVVAMVVPMARGELDSSGAYYSDYNPIGSGTAYVFQDGILTMGHWNKADNSGTLSFTDDAGNALPLNPGQTWITAITSTDKATYK
jgi:hypothetical protein